jgi:hypothetical protein
MNSPTRAFQRLITKHNWHAIWMSLVCLLGALIIWQLIVFFLFLILLGLTTAVLGDWGEKVPSWIFVTAVGLAMILLIWGSLDQWLRRYSPMSDRSIIGWHVIGDALLMPVRITFGIWGNLGALIFLNRDQKRHAWTVLQAMQRAGKVQSHALGQLDSNPKRLQHSLRTLQLLDLVSRYQVDQDAYYLVNHQRSDSLLLDGEGS